MNIKIHLTKLHMLESTVITTIMSDYKDIFRTKESQIFCKAWTAVHITRDGLVEFVDKEFKTFHNSILPAGFKCLLCTTDRVLASKPPLPCPDHGRIRDAIHREHRFSKPIPKYRGPSWNNSKSENWETSSWDIAKCFMPIGGYLDKAAAAETDFNGIIGAIINCKYFQNLFTADLSKDNNICIEARKKVNEIRHFKNMEPGVTDADLNNYIDLFIDLLNDTKTLRGDSKATDARDKLNKLRQDTLVITTEEAGEILQDALTEFEKLQTEFRRTMDSTKQKALKEMKDILDDSNKQLDEIGKEQMKKIEDAGTEQLNLIEEAGADAVSDIKVEVVAAKKELKTEKDRLVKAGAGAVSDIKIEVVAVKKELETEKDRLVKAGADAVSDIKVEVVEAKKELETERDRLVKDLRTQDKKTLDDSYEQRKYRLQQALAHHYWTEYDSLPLSPLMPEVDDKLTKFYMAPKMNKVDTKSYTKSVETSDTMNTYKSLFYNGKHPHRNIYIQGEAGMGKSTFCTKVGLVWSKEKLPGVYKKECNVNKSTVKSKQGHVFSDESAINEFVFLFSLTLRNVEGECEIEQMIENQIISELPNYSKYAGLVPKILDEERCLIILDGLDEWSHQRSQCKKSGLVPHRRSWRNTTVLTSTRPWKMNEVRLRDSDICVLIQITGITDSETFTENVLKCLNDKYNTTLDVGDFTRSMSDKNLNHFLDIPVVTMQLLCLWHSGYDLEDSKCKIYLNMLDMLFGRSQEQSPSVCDDIADNPKTCLPPCFESTRFCEQHKMLLDCLGRLAFHTLHSSNREESLVFRDAIVKSHMKSTVLKTALATGILSQHKSASLIERRSHFSFLHKTFQEFLAAYYIATHVDESENILHTLFQVYGQTVDIMDISTLFVFVCGMNTEMSSKISDSVMKSFSVKLTNHIEELHVSGGNYKAGFMTYSLQEMILTGYKESINNGHRNPQPVLSNEYYQRYYDSDISDDETSDTTYALQERILAGHKESIGSGHQDPQLSLHHVFYGRDVSDDDRIYQDRLVERNIAKIVTLCAWGDTLDVVKRQQILTQSSSTLSHISLWGVAVPEDACLDLFTNIKLKSLLLYGINTHFDIRLNTLSLLYCRLDEINKDVEHSVLSALTTAPQLHTLEVRHSMNMSVLCQVLPTLPMLNTIHVNIHMIPVCLCQALSTLSQLQTLTLYGYYEDPSLLWQALSTLSNLHYIYLGGTDLGDNDILLPNCIQQIELNVKLTCRSFIQLVDRLTQIPHQVTCTLHKCEFRTDYEQYDIVKHIQQSRMFEILQYEIDILGKIYIMFSKIQT